MNIAASPAGGRCQTLFCYSTTAPVILSLTFILLAPPCRVSPRALTAHFISRLVSVEGIVTKASLVRPKVVRSVQYCEATKKFEIKEFRDVTAHDGLPTGAGRC